VDGRGLEAVRHAPAALQSVGVHITGTQLYKVITADLGIAERVETGRRKKKKKGAGEGDPEVDEPALVMWFLALFAVLVLQTGGAAAIVRAKFQETREQYVPCKGLFGDWPAICGKSSHVRLRPLYSRLLEDEPCPNAPLVPPAVHVPGGGGGALPGYAPAGWAPSLGSFTVWTPTTIATGFQADPALHGAVGADVPKEVGEVVEEVHEALCRATSRVHALTGSDAEIRAGGAGARQYERQHGIIDEGTAIQMTAAKWGMAEESERVLLLAVHQAGLRFEGSGGRRWYTTAGGRRRNVDFVLRHLPSNALFLGDVKRRHGILSAAGLQLPALQEAREKCELRANEITHQGAAPHFEDYRGFIVLHVCGGEVVLDVRAFSLNILHNDARYV